MGARTRHRHALCQLPQAWVFASSTSAISTILNLYVCHRVCRGCGHECGSGYGRASDSSVYHGHDCDCGSDGSDGVARDFDYDCGYGYGYGYGCGPAAADSDHCCGCGSCCSCGHGRPCAPCRRPCSQALSHPHFSFCPANCGGRLLVVLRRTCPAQLEIPTKKLLSQFSPVVCQEYSSNQQLCHRRKQWAALVLLPLLGPSRVLRRPQRRPHFATLFLLVAGKGIGTAMSPKRRNLSLNATASVIQASRISRTAARVSNVTGNHKRSIRNSSHTDNKRRLCLSRKLTRSLLRVPASTNCLLHRWGHHVGNTKNRANHQKPTANKTARSCCRLHVAVSCVSLSLACPYEHFANLCTGNTCRAIRIQRLSVVT